jgi:hypothetical protein
VISNPCTFLFLVQRMGVVCFEREAEASRMGFSAFCYQRQYAKRFIERFICVFFAPEVCGTSSLELSVISQLASSLSSTCNSPPIYERHSSHVQISPIRIIPLLTPESYLFLNTPRTPRPIFNPSIFPITKPPLLFAILFSYLS